jgi:hypothetical protein
MSKLRYAIATVALAGALLINIAALSHVSAQAATNRAGMVIQFKDGRVLTRCVSFSEAEISGYDLLRRSKLPVVADVAAGVSICKIDNTGCNFPAQQCFCECQDLNATCIYWTYFFQANGAWKYASLGAALQKVTNGSVNGWIYGVGNASGSAIAPPLMSFDQICGAQTDAPASAPATTTPEPAAAATAMPAPTSAPSATAQRPVSTPTAAPTPVQAATTTATTTQPPATPATATRAPLTATAQPAATPTPTPQPTASPIISTPVPTALPDSPAPASPDGSTTASYLVFGGIAAGLVAVLLFTRRNTGARKP